MAQVSRSKATLRLIGDKLQPQEISVLLGCEGTTMYSKGDLKVVKRSGREYVCKSGHWSLAAKECKPEDLDGQVKEILDRLTDNIAIWEDLSQKYSIDLFCGIFMDKGNEGMNVSPKTLLELGSRGIVLSLDIYDGAD